MAHIDTRLLAVTKLTPLQNYSTSSMHDLTDISVVDCLEMFEPQTHRLEWLTKDLVFLRGRQRFCGAGRGGMLHMHRTQFQEYLLRTRLEVEQQPMLYSVVKVPMHLLLQICSTR